MILTPKELIALTGKERTNAQRRQLDCLRVPYRVRLDGSLVVLARAVEIALGLSGQSQPEEDDPRPTADQMQGMSLDQIDSLPIAPAGYELSAWMDGNWRQFVAGPDMPLTEYRLLSGPQASGIYFLFYRGGLVYVGKADSPISRLKAHRLNSDKTFNEYGFIRVPRILTAYVEAPYIDALSPAWNAKSEPHIWGGRDEMAFAIRSAWAPVLDKNRIANNGR